MSSKNNQAELAVKFQQAVQLQQNANLQDAETIYKDILKIYPLHTGANTMLGIIYVQTSRDNDGVRLLEASLIEDAKQFWAHNALGVGLFNLKKYDLAVISLNQAIDINSSFTDAYFNLGKSQRELGEYRSAIISYSKCIELDKNYANAFNNQGVIFLEDLKDYNKALENFQKFIKLVPNSFFGHNNIAIVLSKLERHKESKIFNEKALKLQADPKEDIILTDNDEDKISKYKKEILLHPDNAQAHLEIGDIFRKLQRIDESVESYDRAIKIKPKFVRAHINRGIIFHELKCHSEAIINFSHAISIEPNNILALRLRSAAHKELGNHVESIKDDEVVLPISMETPYLLGSILDSHMKSCNWENFDKQRSDITKKIKNQEHVITPFFSIAFFENPELHKSAAELYNKKNFPINKLFPKIKKYSNHKKIRIGYFSGDFRNHPVSTLTAELFELHNHSQFKIYAFSYGANDFFTERLKKSFDEFIDIERMTNNDVVLLGRQMEIDIAIDLGGYSGDQRVGIFAGKVAPIQLSYIGYLGTMGSEYYDYLLADRHIIPEGMRKWFTEKIIYLPSFQVNDNKKFFPDNLFTKENLDLPLDGFVFCCFNNCYKILPATFDSWMRILGKVEGSVLFLYAPNEKVIENLRKEASTRGINPDRLIFGAEVSMSDYLARYRNADLFLDTSPYNAGATASDALRSELPLITLIGSSFASRHAASILNAVGLPELITESTEEYESLAVELATNPEKLSIIKAKLVKNLSSSLLLDTRLFSQNIESAYHKIYQRYQDGVATDHIFIK